MVRSGMLAITRQKDRRVTAEPTINQLTPADHESILRVLRDDGGYAVRVNGRPADETDASDLLTTKPEIVRDEDLHVLGLTVDGELVGVASLIVGWPEPDITYLGLLQIRADHQGRGLARWFHSQLRGSFPGRWRLAVVDANAVVVPFWETLGYSRTGEMTRWTSSGGLQHETVQMETPAFVRAPDEQVMNILCHRA